MDAEISGRLSIFIFPMIFCFTIIFFPPAETYSSNETDLRSLLAFKSAIDLDPLGALISWNETTHFCRWNGVQCGRRHPDRVVAINLRSQGLVGFLSPHLGNLSLLTFITLQNNTFHGIIPQEITLLSRLQYVEFSNNSFIGSVPQNISYCLNLVYLNLLDNHLSGAIPEELGSMSKLEALGLTINTFSGPIPPFLGNITSLNKLSLISSGFKGGIPASLAQLQNLKFLQLGENKLTGTVPSGLFNLSFIEMFSVSDNQLHGSIPSSIGLTLPNLKGFYLHENKFTGPIPVSISNASLLERLQLGDNYFTGPIPRVGSLVHLQSFDFHSNLIADDASFITSLTNSSELLYLEFGNNLLTGLLPESISNMSEKIIVIYLEKNKIHGEIPSGIGNLNSLAEFSVADNFLEGRIPVDFARLSNLRSLYLERNMFSNVLNFSFGNLTFLTRLFLHENNLSGNVPSSLASCTNLLELDLSRNNFHGFIPRGVLNLSHMSIVLNLSYNALEGSIPDEVGSLRNLAALDLSNNNLSGVIPSSLSKYLSLEKLYLDGNLLEGEIPLGLSALVGLQELDLSMNNLSHQIPTLLGKLKLQKLNLSFNRLQGEVPTIGVFMNITSISVEGNDGLCGGIPEYKLPPCPSVIQKKRKNLSTLKKILIPIVIVGGICLTFFSLLIYKQRLSKKKASPSLPSFTGIEIMRLSHLDLLKATDGFSETNLLGLGRFGLVYKGVVGDDLIMIAVKVLNLSVRGASRSFVAECNVLRNVRHRNLLKILSVCESIDSQGNEFKALVYEYKANGSLEKWLHQNAESNSNLDMMKRLNIAIDIAEGIEYLHFSIGLKIVHGDLKPSNILLDQDMTAYVGDFGLAKIISDIIPSHERSSSIGIKGTIGYVPPEYGMSSPVSTQGDVYSYGIILLEMFTNIRPTDDNLLDDHVNLHSLVSAALPDRVIETVDPQLQTLMMNNDRMKSCMTSILSLGVSCSKEMPRERMSMTDVLIQLYKIHKLLST